MVVGRLAAGVAAVHMAGCAKEKSVLALWILTCCRAWNETESRDRAGFTTQTWHEECWQTSKDGSCDVTLQVRQFAIFAASSLQQELKIHICCAGSAAKSFQYIHLPDAKLTSVLGGSHRQLDRTNTSPATFNGCPDVNSKLSKNLSVKWHRDPDDAQCQWAHFVGSSFRIPAMCNLR